MARTVYSTNASRSLENARVNLCEHEQVNEIGEDFDKDGRLLRLVRCRQCGLLMRIYIPSV
jgi:hypothetical protein